MAKRKTAAPRRKGTTPAKARSRRAKKLKPAANARRSLVSPQERAGRLLERAIAAARPESRIKFAIQALEAFPDCSDAFLLLSEHTADRLQERHLVERAVASAEKNLGPDPFGRDAGKFWSLSETRPYMRAKLALAENLWSLREREGAAEQLRDMLRLNPKDNQGARYLLAAWLLDLGHDAELGNLLRQYDENSAFWLFSRSLHTFRREGDSLASRKLLAKAAAANKHVVPLLLGTVHPPAEQAESYSRGDEREAAIYFADNAGGWRQTPGAVSWLRRVMFETRGGKKKKGKTAVGPTASAKARLKKLPQNYELVCQVLVSRMPNWTQEREHLVRPWNILVVNATDHLIIGQQLLLDEPAPNVLWDHVIHALEKPTAGSPQRPSAIEVIESSLWTAVEPHLQEVGIDCLYRDRLEEANHILREMIGLFEGDSPFPPLCGAPGLTKEFLREFFDAAAGFFRAAPWRSVADDAAIRVACDQFMEKKIDPWHAVVMGQGGMTYGLALYDELESLRDLWSGCTAFDDPDAQRNAFSLMFGEAFHIAAGDLLAVEENGWPVATPEAYPTVFRLGRHREIRAPQEWELRLVIGVLRALPEFIARHDLEQAASETFSIPVADERLKFTLSFAPEDHLDACDGDCDHCEHACEDHCDNDAGCCRH